MRYVLIRDYAQNVENDESIRLEELYIDSHTDKAYTCTTLNLVFLTKYIHISITIFTIMFYIFMILYTKGAELASTKSHHPLGYISNVNLEIFNV